MPVIRLSTHIAAPIGVCFDLSRSIDLHMVSTAHTGERAIAGRTSGLIQLNETVTWSAVHLGLRQELQSKITAMQYPVFFQDEMLRGAFRSFYHEHHFGEIEGGTLMRDVFNFESPLGILGDIANKIFLTKYVTALLSRRNEVIKSYAESGEWKQFLDEKKHTQN